jgi:hypothetical protein
MTIKISSLENGSVLVVIRYTPDPISADDYPDEIIREEIYTRAGHYVHRILPSGRTEQVCEGLQPRGPTLMIMPGQKLEDVIRETLDK